MQKPNMLQRARAALSFYRHGWAAFGPMVNRKARQRAPYMIPAWRDGVPTWQLTNYDAYVNEGYSQNAILFAAASYKVRSVTMAPLRAYTGTYDAPELLPADNALQQLVSRPNRWQSGREFQGLADLYFNLAGNVYIAVIRQRKTKVPRALYLLRPDRVYIVPKKNKRDLIGYLYVPEGVAVEDGEPFLPQDIIHIKWPNPGDPLEGLGYGLSPIKPMARAVDVDNSATDYLKQFFENGAMPPGVLSYDVPMEPEDVTTARERFMEIYGGYENWVDIAVLDQGGKYQQIGLSFKDMDLSVIDARNESRIVGPLGVPMTLIESRPQMVQSTYSNKETDRRMFWEDTMSPELAWFEADYRYYLQGDNGEFVQFDLTQVPALSLTAKERFSLATEAFAAGGITRDEYRTILPFVLGMGVPVDAQQTESGAPEAETGADSDSESGSESAGQSPASESKAAKIDPFEFWVKTDELAIDHESLFAESVRAAFEQNFRDVAAMIGKAGKTARAAKATVDFTATIDAVNEYYGPGGLAETIWTDALDAAIDILAAAKVLQLNETFGFDTPPGDVLSQNWLEEYKLIFAQPINETSAGAISELLQQGIDDGWGTNEATKHLAQMFEQWKTGELTPEDFEWLAQRAPYYRTEAIVRTETMRASNAASMATFGVWGVPKKEWLATGDNRVRPTHKSASGQTVGITESFDVGGSEMRFPGDPRGSAKETINCRCTVLPVWDD